MKLLGLDLVRGKNQHTAEFLKPYFVLQPFHSRDMYAQQLAQLLQAMGDNIFVLCAIQSAEDQEPQLVGFIIAYINLDNQCHLPQCWVDEKKAPSGTSTLLYTQMLRWAETKGCRKVLGELRTKGDRRAQAAFRRWGFTVHSYGVGVELTDAYMAKVDARLSKEVKNYELRKQRPESGNSEQSDASAKADGGSTV
jgi:hypothetical protein